MTRLSARHVWAAAGVLSLAAVAVPRFAAGDAPAQPATAPAAATLPASTQPSSTQPATAPAGPPTVKVAKGELSLEVRADAVFQPVEPFEVKPTFKAYAGALVVASVAPPGSLVRKDQPVIAFDRTWVDWNLQGAESEMAVAKANQAKAEADAKVAVQAEQIALRQAEEGVKNAEGGKKWFDDVEGPQMLLTADLQVKSAQSSVDDQTDELDQLRKMYQGEQLTTATADIVVRRAVRSLDQGKIILKMQQERRDKTKAYDYPITRQRVIDSVEQSKQQLAMTKSLQDQTAVARAAGLLAAKVGVEQATKKLADLKEDAAQFQIKASSDGVLAYGTQTEGVWTGGDPKLFKVGEKVAPGQVLMRIYQPGKLRLVLALPEAQAFWVEQGMKARVTPAATPQTSYAATTSAVEAMSKGPQGLSLVATVDLDNVDARLQPGMRAAVVIDAGKLTDVLLVPLASVTGGKVRVKEKDGTVAEKVVKLGKTDGQQVEVKSGLAEGDEVVKK
jgi:multidrug resistance efflux pump